jgi:hypothetical protein
LRGAIPVSQRRWFLIFAIVAGFGLAPAQETQVPFSITISAASTAFKANSEVKISLVFKNTSGHEIPYTRGPGTGVERQGELFTSVDVRDAKGELVPDTAYHRALRGKPDKSASSGPPTRLRVMSGSFVDRLLKPGESREEEIVVSKLYDLREPGQYSITAWRRLLDLATHPYSKIVAKSNTLIITVTD